MKSKVNNMRVIVYNQKEKEENQMKKLITLLLTVIITFSFTACNGLGVNKETAFDVSKEAYDNVVAAYKLVEEIGSNIYEAWRLGIYEDDEIVDDGVKYLSSKLDLTEDEIIAGVALTLAGEDGEPNSELSKSTANLYFILLEEELFSFCVAVTSNAYKANGKINEVQTILDSSKDLMKKLSEQYSDYEHYPNLKKYYTNTKSFFEFCQNPTGSFEQVKNTINDYKNKARDYASDLDYIFED